MDQLSFTFTEVLSLIGVVQCVYVLVHVSFRARKNLVRVFLPVLYFFMLGAAFLLDMARSSIGNITHNYEVLVWGAWMSVIPLGVLLIIQMAQITKLPALGNWLILAIVPVAYGVSVSIAGSITDCAPNYHCQDFVDLLNVAGVVGGGLCLLLIWGNRNLFEDLLKQKAGKERYWLALSLIILNVAFLIGLILQTSGLRGEFDIILLRTILGLAFVYLASTSLFRIYPVALFAAIKREEDVLTDDENEVVLKIKNLLSLEKVYLENGYSRSDLAKELGVSDATVSKLINVHFKKSFPTLLNEYRIEDAKRLLLDTDASVKVIAEDVGFNSLPSFNRAFKDIVKQSPSSYRKNMIK